ncbi:cytolysin-activating lysine-acyltransferase [Rhodovulum iodosum]|uniref:RTX toxin-activating lysine-acyltransferase n=1 Tax=Rhodovulum iodosum TaxID=68291 RepID=A0ABV3XW35_9RHOB|nr:toxin-activating lysine-acyltransferase [Rhodovulum robiginosum]
MGELTDATGAALPAVEAPSADLLRAYGDMAFLAFRSPRHGAMSVGELRRYLEPPLTHGQFRLFRFDGVPRGMYTWAWLTPEAERRLIVGDPLDPEDWAAGERLWIVDLIAPYRGLTSSMVRWVMVPGHFTDRSFLFRRVDSENRTRRIVHIDFRRARLSKVMDEAAFLAAQPRLPPGR